MTEQQKTTENKKTTEDLCTPEEREVYKGIFDTFDNDKSGSISCTELATIMRQLGQNPTENQVAEMIAEVDANGNGTIEFEEFLELFVGHKKEHDPLTELREAFEKLDTDGSGFLEREELKRFMTGCGEPVSEEEVDEFITSADTNGDGKIDINEFIALMTS